MLAHSDSRLGEGPAIKAVARSPVEQLQRFMLVTKGDLNSGFLRLRSLTCKIQIRTAAWWREEW